MQWVRDGVRVAPPSPRAPCNLSFFGFHRRRYLLFHLIVHWTCAGGAGGVDDGDDGVPSLLVVVVATFPPSWW